MASSTTLPTEASVAAAVPMPDILPPVRQRKGVIGFLRRNPTITIGASLVLLMVAIAIFAPFLFTRDPTALAPALRTGNPRRSSGSAPTCWAAMSIRGCSTAPGCR